MKTHIINWNEFIFTVCIIKTLKNKTSSQETCLQEKWKHVVVFYVGLIISSCKPVINMAVLLLFAKTLPVTRFQVTLLFQGNRGFLDIKSWLVHGIGNWIYCIQSTIRQTKRGNIIRKSIHQTLFVNEQTERRQKRWAGKETKSQKLLNKPKKRGDVV